MHLSYEPMTYRKKQTVSLRMAYLGGYASLFAIQARRMIAMGFDLDKLMDSCIDDKMKEWLTKLDLDANKTK